ncbi:MAG: alanine racemase [Alphaproteobacteria bacterium]|nr:alanine racemase [Alphaproteobacteria bacterium]MBU1513218.1 alanine racemase [Alphaproteobacteria bacterium]MBU2095326.1 alanine racemase [Alphaproteobacteria bacterium]MBU2152241.1 alanine racemase [Alphaproteobacteria bacterium]MBU2306712.1 alanine racemase [Alphaproteobacteria bacterium]
MTQDIRDRLGALADKPHVALALAHLGEPASAHLIPTPASVLDLDAFDRNVAKMAARAKAAGLALRPHSKSHKCAALVRRQIEAGAAGICCAKLAEAEAMAAAGIGQILVTSPFAGTANAQRAAKLAATLPDFRIVLDHPDAAAELGAAAQGPVQVVIDIDVGMGRTGCHDAEQAAAVARAIAAQPHLRLLGVQGYGGGWQHIEGANARASAAAEGMAKLTAAIGAIRAAGGDVQVVTGGGTGTFAADAAQGVLNEVQPGSYAFMDKEYRDALKSDPDGAFEQAAMIVTTVISANHPKWVTLDAGLKAFSTEGPMPQPLTAKFATATYRFFGDEHGMIGRPAGAPTVRGERLALAPGHIDPTLDRYDLMHLVQGDVLVDIVRLEARGASQ